MPFVVLSMVVEWKCGWLVVVELGCLASFPGNCTRRSLQRSKRCLMLLGHRRIVMGLRCPTVCWVQRRLLRQTRSLPLPTSTQTQDLTHGVQAHLQVHSPIHPVPSMLSSVRPKAWCSQSKAEADGTRQETRRYQLCIYNPLILSMLLGAAPSPSTPSNEF